MRMEEYEQKKERLINFEGEVMEKRELKNWLMLNIKMLYLIEQNDVQAVYQQPQYQMSNSYKIQNMRCLFLFLHFIFYYFLLWLPPAPHPNSPYLSTFFLQYKPIYAFKTFMQNSVMDLPLTNIKPIVQVYAIMNEHREYEDVGTGTLEIVTDADTEETQHYIQVTATENKELILRSRLQIRNNFQRQKNAIICWEDIEQISSEQLALSFEKADECDIYWKYICQKIGKNYLEINGNETLNNPTQANVSYILEKAKSSYNLIAFHIMNSDKFMEALRQVFFAFQEKNNKVGLQTIMKVIKQILSHLDHKVINLLLEQPNFSFLLELYKDSTGINFPYSFERTLKIKELIHLQKEIMVDINKYHHFVFFRDFILDLSKDTSLDQMLSIWNRETEINILKSLFQDKIFKKICQFYAQKCNEPNIEKDILDFIFQMIGMLKQAQSDSLKNKFVQSFYESNIFNLLQQILKEKNHFKIFQIFDFVCLLNPDKFLTFFREEFRENPSLNIASIISNQFSLNQSEIMGSAIANFLNTILTQIVTRKEVFQFFNSTILHSVFTKCKFTYRNLLIVRLILQKANKATGLVNFISKTMYFYKLVLNQKAQKKVLIELFKILKLIILINKRNDNEKSISDLEDQNKLNEELIQSGVFTFCLEYVKKNKKKNSLVTSIMFHNLVLISDMKYNPFVQLIQKFDFQLEDSHQLKKYIQEINKKVNQVRKTDKQRFDMRKKKHFNDLQDEEDERYIQGDDEIGEDERLHEQTQQDKKNREQLLRMQEQMKKERNEETSQELKKVKSAEKDEQKFDIVFDMDDE